MHCEGLSTVAKIGELTNGTQTLLRILPIETNSVGSGDREMALKVNALAEAEDDLKRAGRFLPRPVKKIVFSNSRLEDVVRFETIANETDLIAVAANGRSPLKRCLAPELFDYLLQDTDVPVLVFRPAPGKRDAHPQ
jgi:nucleotide-binding universal stress UspA family protein